jgi:[acyl-carrier-protein] S-malonyltransferase
MFDGPIETLTLTENAQPALLAVSMAAMRVLEEHGFRLSEGAQGVKFVAGHSLGEYSALCAAGALSVADGARLLRIRGRAMQAAVPVGQGAMAAILMLDADGVARACADASSELGGRVVTPANLNAPGQVVIAGHADAVALAGEKAKALGAKRVIPLAVSAPFHCPLMQPAEERLAGDLRALPVRAPRVPVVANVDAEAKRDAASAIEALIRQVSSPVRWEQVVRRLVAEGARTFVELGPGAVLAGLVKKIDRSATVVSIEDDAGFTAALSQLRSA